MIKLADIAKHLGLSVTTVSYALNNDQRIPPATRQRVVDAARQLGYSGKSGRTTASGEYLKQVVLCIHSLSGGIYNELIAEMRNILRVNNCELMIYLGSNISQIKWLDGLFVLNARVSTDDIIKMTNRRIPVVVMDREETIDNASHVTLDNFGGCYETTRYALNAGAKSFVFIGGPKESFESSLRYGGFCKALNDNKIATAESSLLQTDFSYEGGVKTCRFILEEAEADLPDAIICANDETAMGIIAELKRQNIKKNIIVTGFDGVAPKDGFRFVTAKVDRKYWASTAVYTMIKRFEHGTDQRIKVPVQAIDFNY